MGLGTLQLRGLRIPMIASLCLALSITLTTTSATPANADTMTASGTLYKSDDLCTWGSAELNHGSYGWGGIGITTSSLTRIWTGGAWVRCGTPWFRPGGSIRAASNLWKWTGSTWAICDQQGWFHNSEHVSYLQVGWTYLPEACGEGAYYVHGMHGVWNSGWYGGDLNTNWHWLPDNPISPAPQKLGLPPGFQADGTVDLAQVPKEAPRVDKKGKIMRDATGAPVMISVIPSAERVAAATAAGTITKAPSGHIVEKIDLGTIAAG